MARSVGKGTLMEVAVAIHTGGELERLGRGTLTMALFAGHGDMLAAKRKASLVVIELSGLDVFPTVQCVTAFAIVAKAAFMDIGVTIGALCEGDRLVSVEFGIVA